MHVACDANGGGPKDGRDNMLWGQVRRCLVNYHYLGGVRYAAR